MTTSNDRWIRACGSGTCIEVRPSSFGQHIVIRDSERPDETVVTPAASWEEFLTAVKAGEFDGMVP